jgi:hypothetical protein
MADSSETNPVMELEDTWKIPVSRDIGPDNNWMNAKFTRLLQEHYALKQAINIFLDHITRLSAHSSLVRDFTNTPTWLKLILHTSRWSKPDFCMTVS